MIKEKTYYNCFVRDLILKAKAYDAIKGALQSDICTISIVTTLDTIITDTEVQLHASDHNRDRTE